MHPEFIRIGPFDIRSYGVLVALGFMAGLYLAAWGGRREGLGSQRIMDLGVWLIVAGMLGAKLYYVVVLWPDFIAGWRAEGLRSLRQGFVFFGGFIAACVATIVHARNEYGSHNSIVDLSTLMVVPIGGRISSQVPDGHVIVAPHLPAPHDVATVPAQLP